MENFGTWRDAEGRLIWGINDFDEAHTAAVHQRSRPPGDQRVAGRPHTQAPDLPPGTACQAIVDGYPANLARGGRPSCLPNSAVGSGPSRSSN